jgi:hypothetical protein
MPHVSEHHAQHDPLLVASLAAGDLAGADRDHANAQISACAECATLHADLIAIARATAALPPAVAPRDFRLSPEQAAALRPVGWRRLVAAIGGSRPLLSRQLGIGLATIGIAGLLVSTLPGIQLGGTAAAPQAPSTREAATSAEQRAAMSGDKVTIAGEGVVSPAPANLGPMSNNDSSDTAASRAPEPDTFGSAAGLASGLQASPAAAAPAASAGAFAPSVGDAVATPADRNLGQDNTVAATPSTSPAADGGQNLLALASIIALAAGIALLVMRRLTRRPI